MKERTNLIFIDVLYQSSIGFKALLGYYFTSVKYNIIYI